MDIVPVFSAPELVRPYKLTSGGAICLVTAIVSDPVTDPLVHDTLYVLVSPCKGSVTVVSVPATLFSVLHSVSAVTALAVQLVGAFVDVQRSWISSFGPILKVAGALSAALVEIFFINKVGTGGGGTYPDCA
jgi:hypothetical protein